MANTTNVEKIMEFFRDSSDDYWKTVDEVSRATKIDQNTIKEILTNSGDFVRSSYRVKNGEPLYTSREMYRNKAPFVDKLIGSINYDFGTS